MKEEETLGAGRHPAEQHVAPAHVHQLVAQRHRAFVRRQRQPGRQQHHRPPHADDLRRVDIARDAHLGGCPQPDLPGHPVDFSRPLIVERTRVGQHVAQPSRRGEQAARLRCETCQPNRDRAGQPERRFAFERRRRHRTLRLNRPRRQERRRLAHADGLNSGSRRQERNRDRGKRKERQHELQGGEPPQQRPGRCRYRPHPPAHEPDQPDNEHTLDGACRQPAGEPVNRDLTRVDRARHDAGHHRFFRRSPWSRASSASSSASSSSERRSRSAR